jgi:hypothetical protein
MAKFEDLVQCLVTMENLDNNTVDPKKKVIVDNVESYLVSYDADMGFGSVPVDIDLTGEDNGLELDCSEIEILKDK